MSGSNWRLFIAAIGCLIAAGIGLYLLSPWEPEIARQTWPHHHKADYYPGGADCQPSRIGALRSSRERMAQRQRCAEADEEHRLKEDDLTQQTRSADAAESIQRIAISQSFALAAGTALGLLTLFAAIAAALYARQAARAAESTLAHAKSIADEEIRPYVAFHWEEEGDEPLTREGILAPSLKNYGKTPAVNLRVFFGTEIAPWPLRDYKFRKGANTREELSFLAQGADHPLELEIKRATTESQWEDIIKGVAILVLHLRVEYEGRLGHKDSSAEIMYVGRELRPYTLGRTVREYGS